MENCDIFSLESDEYPLIIVFLNELAECRTCPEMHIQPNYFKEKNKFIQSSQKPRKMNANIQRYILVNLPNVKICVYDI